MRFAGVKPYQWSAVPIKDAQGQADQEEGYEKKRRRSGKKKRGLKKTTMKRKAAEVNVGKDSVPAARQRSKKNNKKKQKVRQKAKAKKSRPCVIEVDASEEKIGEPIRLIYSAWSLDCRNGPRCQLLLVGAWHFAATTCVLVCQLPSVAHRFSAKKRFGC